jgi:methionine synthase I (cobalamin-dependent)
MSSLRGRLAESGIIVLDGGVGSEIQRRGVALDPCAWSGFSHWHHPELVLAIHKDYIRAGAEVITTNTFSSAKHILEDVGLGEDFERINRRAVDLAKQARDEVASREVWIAGSLSTIPPLDRPATVPAGPEVGDNYRRQARILADAGADLLIAEMLLDSESAVILVDACLATGLPVWAGFSASIAADRTSVHAFRAPGKYTAMRDQPFEGLLRNVLREDVDVAGVMHTKLPVMAPALSVLARMWSGPKMAYGETGRAGASEWFFEDIVAPEVYVEHARTWIGDFGVQVVGGCCGTGPEHIEALSRIVSE